MRVAIIGPGGVGGYFGARLAVSGCDVRFIGRGAHLAAMRKNGLRVYGELGETFLPDPQASDDATAFGPADVILLCVKLWDTDGALRAAKSMLGPETAVLSLQNGVQKDDTVRAVVGERAAVGGVSYIAAKIEEPGVVKQTGKMAKLIFGERDGTPSERLQSFLECCQHAGINAELSLDVQRATWEKFVFLVGLSASTCAMRTTLGPIRDHPSSRAFLLNVMREVVAVGRAHRVRLDEDLAEQRLRFFDGLAPETTSSMHTDLERGRRLELAWLSGAVVELGKEVGVPTPLNGAIADILALHAQGRVNIDS